MAGLVLTLTAGVAFSNPGPGVAPTPLEELGRQLFFDKRLSQPPGQSCASCHGLEVGGTGPDEKFNRKGSVYEGAKPGRFGNRKPPTPFYIGDTPVFRRTRSGLFKGGLFWDGRATGEKLGDPLAEQALGPFFNPLEHNLPDQATLVALVKSSAYAGLFEKVWGEGALDPQQVDLACERIGRALAAFERSPEVNPFSSRFDDFWRRAKDKGLDVQTLKASNYRQFEDLGLTEDELQGLRLFATRARCATCHELTSINGRPPVFTDFTYDNAGVPRNPDLPFYRMGEPWNSQGKNWVDPGLGGYLEGVEAYKALAAAERGAHKVPTLRNVDKRPHPDFVKAYMHNGVFKSLKQVVHFYNTRDVPGAGWSEPEVPEHMERARMGNLGLTEEEEDQLVLFMQTLSDR